MTCFSTTLQFQINGQEQLPNSPAYLHVSKPSWGDENMNGIHLETYVLSKQLENNQAPVAIHCEGGCFQSQFMQLFTDRAAAEIKSWPGDYRVLGPGGSSVCEDACGDNKVNYGRIASTSNAGTADRPDDKRLQGSSETLRTGGLRG